MKSKGSCQGGSCVEQTAMVTHPNMEQMSKTSKNTNNTLSDVVSEQLENKN